MYPRTVRVNSSSGTVIDYVRVVEAYRDGGKVKQRVVADLGRKDLLVDMLPKLRRLLAGNAAGIEPNEKHIREHLDDSLMLVTALNPHIGYEKAAQISLTAYCGGLSLREAAVKLGALTPEQFDEWVHPEDRTRPLSTRG